MAAEEDGAPIQFDTDELKTIFREGGSITGGLHTLANYASDAGEDDMKKRVVAKIDDLIWRRKMLDKPHDQLDEIKDMVEKI